MNTKSMLCLNITETENSTEVYNNQFVFFFRCVKKWKVLADHSYIQPLVGTKTVAVAKKLISGGSVRSAPTPSVNKKKKKSHPVVHIK